MQRAEGRAGVTLSEGRVPRRRPQSASASGANVFMNAKLPKLQM